MCDPNASLDYGDMIQAQIEDELQKLRPLLTALVNPDLTHFRLHCGSCMDDFEIGDFFEIPDGEPDGYTATAEVGGICPGCGEGDLELVVYFCGGDRGTSVMKLVDAQQPDKLELSELAQPKPCSWECNNPKCTYAGGYGVEPPVNRDCPLCGVGTLVPMEEGK